MMEDSDELKPSKEKVLLAKDVYGTFSVRNDEHVKVYRFTWYSHNRIQVQVITYGARIIAMKSPCRNGVVEDILMGFDKLSDYMMHDPNNFGATIGRCAGLIENATFSINGKQFWLEPNYKGIHHLHGGYSGFHKKLFTPHVEGKKLILSCISEDEDEGYPGAIFLRITYELSSKNEFRVNMEAFSTKETIINLTNCLYFNLAGHGAGINQMRRHYVTINANCFTVKRSDGFPTGEIKSVINTDFNYQVPVIGNELLQHQTLDECLCVNRGTDQGNCFVASLFHPPSGRMLEIYSNQPGINVSLPNNLGPGILEHNQEIQQKRMDDIFDILKVIHGRAKQLFEDNEDGDLAVVRDLTGRLSRRAKRKTKLSFSDDQVQYLKIVRDAALAVQQVPVFKEVAELINAMLSPDKEEEPEDVEQELQKPAFEKAVKNNTKCKEKDERFIGKNGAIYVNKGSICLQTQNYPNAIYHKNFPNCLLKPGEMYQHTIVYKFWVRTGSPAKWMRRANREFRVEEG